MSTDPIRVFLVDDDEGFRGALRKLLGLEQDIAVVGEAGSGEELLSLDLNSLPTDVIVMDIKMPGIGGLEASRRLKERGTKSKIIIFTQFHWYISYAASLGASAAVYKLAALERGALADIIRLVVQSVDA
ncbi:MAG: response regulator transcription factor [Chloroflexi bacterium]|nr:response regulator transcription factor [Chloroflexota bacterium]